jgi:hypothetical protein
MTPAAFGKLALEGAAAKARKQTRATREPSSPGYFGGTE